MADEKKKIVGDIIHSIIWAFVVCFVIYTISSCTIRTDSTFEKVMMNKQ